jgi:hypothetical protein
VVATRKTGQGEKGHYLVINSEPEIIPIENKVVIIFYDEALQKP